VRALATIFQQNHRDVNQMNILLAKLPNISQDFGSQMNNLARDAVENLFVDEFRNRIDEIIAESLQKHFEKHLNATNITYKMLNGRQQA
jgi:ATP-dependent Clp protease ATP-binding subunit ClpA